MKTKEGRFYRIDKDTYVTWVSMKSRCRDKENKSYEYCGAKGIKVCARWEVLENFIEDMGLRPKGMSLDRIDNTKNYYKENCKWSTKKQQENNKTNNIVIEYEDQKHTLAEWSRILGIHQRTLHNRLFRSKMSVATAFDLSKIVLRIKL